MNDWSEQTAELGRRIRELRRQSGLTLQALAEAAGVSRSLISQVERGKAVPSVSSLIALAEALNCSASAFFPSRSADGGTDQYGRRLVVKASDRRRVRVFSTETACELLTPDVNRKIEFLRGVILPGQTAPEDEGVWAAHIGEENAFLLEGSVVYVVDGNEYELNAGDSISFDCCLPHRLENRSEAKAVLIMAISPPAHA